MGGRKRGEKILYGNVRRELVCGDFFIYFYFFFLFLLELVEGVGHVD